MSGNIKVSVIIPVYNGEKYIKECIDNLKMESYPDIEIIAVDDGSSDATPEILRGLQRGCPKLTVITQKNGGAAAARNTGLDAAVGDAVIFLDCDDKMQTDCIGALVDIMCSENADIVRFRLCYSYPDGTVRDGRAEFGEQTVTEKDGFFENVYRHMLRGVRYNHIVRTLYKRSVIDGVRFRTDLQTAEDLCFNIQAFSNAKRYVYTPDIRYYYYCSGTGLTGSALTARQKLACNAKAARALKDALKAWGADSITNRVRADLRIVRITIAKIRRALFGGDAF